jgi:hypothetical protein
MANPKSGWQTLNYQPIITPKSIPASIPASRVTDTSAGGSFAIPRDFHKRMDFDRRPIFTELTYFKSE